jgi:hypothetical protein
LAAELAERLGRGPRRLRQDGDAEALGLEHAAEQGGGERRVVDVGVAADEDHVDRVPAARLHLGGSGGQEAVGGRRAAGGCHRGRGW